MEDKLKHMQDLVQRIASLQDELDTIADGIDSICCITKAPRIMVFIGSNQECREYLLDHNFVTCATGSYHLSGTAPANGLGYLDEYTFEDPRFYTLHDIKYAYRDV